MSQDNTFNALKCLQGYSLQEVDTTIPFIPFPPVPLYPAQVIAKISILSKDLV